MRKFLALRRTIAFALSAALSVSVGGCGGSYSAGGSSETFSVTVEADKTSTYSLGDITVTVPEGAVPKDTKLTATVPVAIDSAIAPLGANSVQFDLSFDDGLEPSKPLDIAIPLTGDYLPDGVQAERAFLYSPDGNGNQWLVPTEVTDGVLYAQLNHLSPKVIAYPDDASLQSLISGIPDQPDLAQDCQMTVEVSGGTVKLTGKNWSNTEEDSPINACLSVNGDDASLTIENRVNYILSVASTNVAIDTVTTSANDGVVAALALKMYPAQNTKAFLGRDSELNIVLPSDNLPSTIELIADTNTYFAEISWAALKFLLGVFAGVDEENKIVTMAETVISAPEVVDCLRTAMDASNGEDVSVLDKINFITGKCTELIVTKASSIATSSNDVWGKFWKRIFVIGNGVSTAINTLVTAYDGIRLQFNNTMRLVVAKASSSSDDDSSTCLTSSAADSIQNAYLAELSSQPTIVKSVRVKCFGSWAVSYDSSSEVLGVFEYNSSNEEWYFVNVYTMGSKNDFCLGTSVPQEVLKEMHECGY